MTTIHVIKAFLLTAEDKSKHWFEAGVHDVEDWIAAHWYTKAHSEPVKSKNEAESFDDMTAAEIESLLASEPSKWSEVEAYESARDKPRKGVLSAVEDAKTKASVQTEG